MDPDPSTPAAARSRRRLALLVVGAVVAVLAVVAATVLLVVRDLEDNVARERVFEGLDDAERPVEEVPRALDLLVLGSDSRDDPIGAEFQGEGDEFLEGERADTTLLVRLTADRDAAWVVALPRDSWVTLPSCTTTDGEQLAERQGQLANAFRDGGLGCVVRTVESLTGVRIDHTAVVDFTGFTEMVNALDGVPVCLDEPFRPRRVDLELEPGRHVLRDRDALEFVRARFGLGDGTDLQRIDRQKDFMASMVERATSRQLLARPDRLVRFLSAATSSLRVDEDLDLRALALSLRGLEGDRVVFSTVPLDPDPGPQFREGGRLFGRVAWDEPAAAELFAALSQDRVPEPPAPAPADAGPAPAPDDDVQVTAGSPCA